MRKTYKLSVREKNYFCITIPAEFVKQNNLVLKSQLFVYLYKKQLVISLVAIPNIDFQYLNRYCLSRQGYRGWVLTVPEEWIKLIKGKKDDRLFYKSDRSDILCIEKCGRK